MVVVEGLGNERCVFFFLTKNPKGIPRKGKFSYIRVMVNVLYPYIPATQLFLLEI